MLSPLNIFIFTAIVFQFACGQTPPVQPQTPCLNDGNYLKKSDICTCTASFIGRYCQYPAIALTDSRKEIPLTQNYTFAYYSPTERNIYRLILNFCGAMEGITRVKMFAQEEEKQGQFVTEPNDPKNIKDLNLKNGECVELFSAVLVAVERKDNGELPKIIFGFKSLSQQDNETMIEPYFEASCGAQAYFTVDFLVTVLIVFFATFGGFAVLSLLCVMRKKFMDRRRAQRESRQKMQCVTKIMPSKKYETLVEQNDGLEHEDNCSICLSNFLKGENIRVTPCSHMFHQKCLDSWCATNMTCPICRADFSQLGKQSSRKGEEVVLQMNRVVPGANNLREEML